MFFKFLNIHFYYKIFTILISIVRLDWLVNNKRKLLIIFQLGIINQPNQVDSFFFFFWVYEKNTDAKTWLPRTQNILKHTIQVFKTNKNDLQNNIALQVGHDRKLMPYVTNKDDL